jgi:hypothetical protein
VTPRTLTAAPTDRSMWRRLLRLTHPDGAGSHDLFIWARSLYEHVTGDAIEDARTRAERRQPSRHHESTSTGDRLDFSAAHSHAESFDDLTHRALGVAEEVGQPFRGLLLLLRDCRESEEITLSRQQRQGATYKTLAAIGHAAGMSKTERVRWYRVAERVPLSQRHAGHIMARLKSRAA